jgi:hypothetical protein
MKFRLDLYACGMVRSAYITVSSDLGTNHDVLYVYLLLLIVHK